MNVTTPQDRLKKLAAEKAVESVENGMVVGLGTGSTAYFVVERIGELLKKGEIRGVLGVPTSKKTAEQARSLGIPLASLDERPALDLAIDGADEVDPDLNLVKGRGGALLREKMVEKAASRFIVVVDETKLVAGLGTSGAMPVEVVQFCHSYNAKRLESLGCDVRLRMERADAERPFVTDNGNFILDCFFSTPIRSPRETAAAIEGFTGVVEHGLFLDMATEIVVAGERGITVRARR